VWYVSKIWFKYKSYVILDLNYMVIVLRHVATIFLCHTIIDGFRAFELLCCYGFSK